MCWFSPKQDKLDYKPIKRNKKQEPRIDTSCPFYDAEGICTDYNIKKLCRNLSCRRKQ